MKGNEIIVYFFVLEGGKRIIEVFILGVEVLESLKCSIIFFISGINIRR